MSEQDESSNVNHANGIGRKQERQSGHMVYQQLLQVLSVG